MARGVRPLARPRRIHADGARVRRAPAANPFPLTPSSTPKYLQVAARVIADLKSGRLRRGDQLPSINGASERASLSRDTIMKAYAHLERLQLLEPVHGKGYYLRADAVELKLRTLVVFDTLNAYKERLFAGLREGVAERAELDVWFHHFNPAFMRKLLLDGRGRYDRYVVMPFVGAGIQDALAALDRERLLILDILAEVPDGRCSYLVQSFDAGLVAAFETAVARFRRYRRLVYVDRPGFRNPPAIPGAVARFGERHGLETEVVSELSEERLRPDTAYLVIEDDDLVTLVRWCQRTRRKLGADVGVVSYNDTPLKEVVASGITVVSTDFHAMGLRAAQHVLDSRPIQAIHPTQLILRSSL